VLRRPPFCEVTLARSLSSWALSAATWLRISATCRSIFLQVASQGLEFGFLVGDFAFELGRQRGGCLGLGQRIQHLVLVLKGDEAVLGRLIALARLQHLGFGEGHLLARHAVRDFIHEAFALAR